MFQLAKPEILPSDPAAGTENTFTCVNQQQRENIKLSRMESKHKLIAFCKARSNSII